MSKADNNPEQSLSRRDARDSELFSRFMSGDQFAFKELYATYERPLMLYCQYLLRAELDAQEVFQETWLRVLRLQRKGEEVQHFRALLFKIARNTGLKHLANRKNANTNLSLSVVDPENERFAGTYGQFSEMEDLINSALNQLPVPQREAFVLHSMLGYTFQEIAEMQDCTMTGAKTRAFRARAYLRKLLSSWLALSEDDPEESEESDRGSKDRRDIITPIT
jgi:RNA polymerase sigma-70 factor (ECF subfamily)